MAKHHGKSGMAYLSTSAGGSPAIVNLREWSFDQVYDLVDCSATDSHNREYERGQAGTTGSLSGYWDSASDTLYDASRSLDGANLILYPTRTDTSRFWTGLVWVDFAINTSMQTAVEVSASFTAINDWQSDRDIAEGIPLMGDGFSLMGDGFVLMADG